MSRQPRLDTPDALHHVKGRGIEGIDISAAPQKDIRGLMWLGFYKSWFGTTVYIVLKLLKEFESQLSAYEKEGY